jgi:hypothetical protein
LARDKVQIGAIDSEPRVGLADKHDPIGVAVKAGLRTVLQHNVHV